MGALHLSDLRIVGWNSGGLPHQSTDEIRKNVALREAINAMQPDVLCLSETNTAWHKLPIADRLGERAKDWWGQTYTVCGCYKSYPEIEGPRQPGGCAIVVRNNAVGRVIDSGQDPAGMGRWCWVRLRRSDQSHLLVVCGYHPVRNSGYAYSTYQQQVHGLAAQFDGEEVCPRQQFVVDLE